MARRGAGQRGPDPLAPAKTTHQIRANLRRFVEWVGGKGLASDPTLDPLNSTIPAAAPV